MGLLIEYFAAPSDETAAANIDRGLAQADLPVLDGWSIQMANLGEVLTEFLTALGGLARAAAQRNQNVYCWVCG